MPYPRLTTALFVSLLCHALLAAMLGAGPAASGNRNTPLMASLLDGSAETLASASVASAPSGSPRTDSPRPDGPRPLRQKAEQGQSMAEIAAMPLPGSLFQSNPLPGREPTSVMNLPRQGRIAYALFRGREPIGHALHQWQHDGSRYTIASSISLNASRPLRSVVVSSGLVSAEGLVPLAFQGETPPESVRFDWQALRASAEGRSGPQQEVRLETGAQDALSVLYHLGQSLAHGKRLELMIASGEKFEHRIFEIVGEEETLVGGVNLRSVHIHNRTADSGILELWLSLDGLYLPLRIRQIDRLGQELDQIAEEIEYEGMQRMSTTPGNRQQAGSG